MDAGLRRRYVDAAVGSVGRRGPIWWLVAAALAACVGFGLYAYAVQVRDGHAVTGITHTVFWGIYIVNFVFFIGISYGGAIVSAILRLTNAKWRAPISRLAEGTAVVTLGVGAASVLIDVGRPDRMLNLFRFAQPGSPITWDWVAINTYLVGTLIFFFLPLIPDLGRYAEAQEAAGGGRARLYRVLSFGWRGAPQQERSLLRAMTIMSILIIPLAVSVHSVLAWLFAVTVQSGWHSTIFAPYFVMAAMLSGVAMVILVVAVARSAYGLHEFIGEHVFRYLSYLLIALDAAYMYFMISEYLTEGYAQEQPVGEIMRAYLVGPYAPWLWSFVVGGLVLPIAIVALPGRWLVGRAALASALVVAGMWVKRFLIVILPGVTQPIAPADLYRPTWVEMGITLGAVAAIPLGLMVLFSFVPVMSVHELEEVEGAGERDRPRGRVVELPEPRRGRRGIAVAAAAAAVLVVAAWAQGALGPRVSLVLPQGGAPREASMGTPPAEPLRLAPMVTAKQTRASLVAAPSKKAAQGYVLDARVVTSEGKPANGAAVRFYDVVALLGTREMLIATERSDGQGHATVSYLPAQAGSHTIIARYAVGDDPGEARATLEATLVAPGSYQREELPLAEMSLALPKAAGLALLGVWVLFGIALIGGIRGIATAPRPVDLRKAREDQV